MSFIVVVVVEKDKCCVCLVVDVWCMAGVTANILLLVKRTVFVTWCRMVSSVFDDSALIVGRVRLHIWSKMRL